MNYKNMPHFLDHNDIQWNINAFHVFKGFGERGLEIECASTEHRGLKCFVYKASTNSLVQYDPDEVCHSIPQPCAFWDNCKNLFEEV